MGDFFQELRRRNVYKVATVYAITAWLVAQIIKLAADSFSAPAWVMQMVIVLLIAGFPIALILAWAFEMTPEGLKRTKHLEREETTAARSSSRSRFNFWIIGLLVIALLFLGMERIFFAESSLWGNDPEAQNASIAVLPFADFSAEGDQEYFADGISEELLNSLAQINGLHVAGRTSSFQFKDENHDLKEIGEKLGVDHILEGSVRKAGDQLRITAQLIKIDDGFHVWSQTYDRPYSTENIFDIQDEISQAVLEELKVRLLPAEQENVKNPRPTKNVEAYNLYLKGLSKAATLNPSDLEEAEEFFQQAIALDPEFALAYAKKAETVIFQHILGNAEYEKAIKESGEDIDVALLLKDDLAEAYVALGLNHMVKNQRKTSLLAFKKAKELKPGDAEVSASYGIGLWQNQQRKEAQKELEYAYELDPLSPLVNLYLGDIYQMNGSLEKAEEHLQTAIKIRPDYLVAYESLANLYGAMLGQHDKALITMYKAYKETAEKTKSIRLIFYPAVDLGLLGLANEMLDILKKEFPNNESTLTTQLYWLGRHNKYAEALDLVKRSDSIKGSMPDYFFLNLIEKSALATGKYSYYLTEIKKRSPENLRTDTLNFKERSYSNMLGVVVALRKTGQEKKAKIILQNLNEHLENLPKKETQEFHGRYYWEYTLCKGLMNEKEAVKKALRTRLEGGNIIGHYFVYGIENELFLHLRPEEMRPFKEAEEKIINEQRQNVIAYLKEEGEWKDEWEITALKK
ncbi:tetratricopeptide repeat protein [Salinimicrobium catena]|uniref:tetratricopeptide repeat protein n=1 Tax=Salinimicrobium catena TaxID=390640 RepID=UPI002FE45EB6